VRAGARSRDKVFAVTGVDQEELDRRLVALGEGAAPG
jgi:hypothetical protein